MMDGKASPISLASQNIVCSCQVKIESRDDTELSGFRIYCLYGATVHGFHEFDDEFCTAVDGHLVQEALFVGFKSCDGIVVTDFFDGLEVEAV